MYVRSCDPAGGPRSGTSTSSSPVPSSTDAVIASVIADEAPCSRPSPTVGSNCSADSSFSTAALGSRGAFTGTLATFVPFLMNSRLVSAGAAPLIA